MTEPTTDHVRNHYQNLTSDAQLIWRLQARRNTELGNDDLAGQGEAFAAWSDRLHALPARGRTVRLAIDILIIGLLDPPPRLPPGLLRTAWANLLTANPVVSLKGDAARLETLARSDSGALLDPEAFEDTALDTCIIHEERVRDAVCLPGEERLITHPAATSLPHLLHAIRHGLTLEGATPQAHAAIVRLLQAHRWDDDQVKQTERPSLLEISRDLRGTTSAMPPDVVRLIEQHPELRTRLEQAISEHLPEDTFLPSRTRAVLAVTTVIRLLYLPQLLPSTIDITGTLTVSARLWRMAHDLWTGPDEWRADLEHLRVHLKALGQVNDNHRNMRVLERYGPAPLTQNLRDELEKAGELYNELLDIAHAKNAPDIEQTVLDLPDTLKGRLAGRLAHAALSCTVPQSLWGRRMQTLHARVRNVPASERYRALLKAVDADTYDHVVTLTRSGARTAQLLALSETPGREVLTICAVGLAQLREATKLGAPIGSMTLEFETAVRALWRSLGCPPCSWLTAIHGPTGEEAEARSQQREALITAALEGHLTPENPALLLPAPESYAYTTWDREAAHHDDTEEQPELPFDDLTLTERLVLKALSGKTLVILGGICKPHAKAALIRDLKLKDVDWIESTEYDNGQQAASRLRDPNIVAVIFALRWAGHAHGSIRNVAWALGIPAVSLPGGYSPRQILHQLSAQVSGSLAS